MPHPRLFLLLAVVSCPFGSSALGAEVKGALLFAGGDVRHDNAAVWERYLELAGGKDAAIVVVPAAGFDPRRSGKNAVEHLTRIGAKAEVVPIAPRWPDIDVKEAVKDPAYVAKLRDAKGIWFTGGEQRRITNALLNSDGTRTPALDAIWDAYKDGAVIGGSSAGAAIMSRDMFADAQNSLNTIKNGVAKGKQVDAGLGFIGGEWFVDQHFLKRGRFARALLAMRDCDYKYGIGVDEDTAVVLRGNTFEVVGYKGALVMDIRGADSDRAAADFGMKKAKLTYLDAGDRMDAKTLEVTPSKRKLADRKVDPKAKDFTPYFDPPGESYFADMLAPWAIVEAMTHALDSKDRVVRGLAFAQPEGGKKNDLGFAFRVYRGADTIGWWSDQGGPGRYTVVNAYVDITPVKLPTPIEMPR